MKTVYDSDMYRKYYNIYTCCMFPNFLSSLLYALNRFQCLPPRFLKKETESIEAPVLNSIVQHEFNGLEHFDPVHGLLPFELREKLSMWII